MADIVLCMCVYNRTAYILFVRDQMQKCKGSDFNSNTYHLREFAHSWSKLSPEVKEHYKDLLNKERQQYLVNVQEFKKVYNCHVCMYML